MDDETMKQIKAHLRRERVRLGATNVFLFGPKGVPFWAARLPVSPAELEILKRSLDAIEAQLGLQARPFFGHVPERQFSYGALVEDELSFVLVLTDPDRTRAEARVARVGEDLRRLLAPQRPYLN
jgi:hypothetical protein